MNGMIFDIQRGSLVDGPGVRTTVFFKGCNLRCAWCHNPESHSMHAQMLISREKCILCGKCKKACPNGLLKCDFCGKCEVFCPADARKICGNEMSVSEVLFEILSDKDYYSSGGGMTASGGECMLQIDFLEELLKECSQNRIHTAVDTAGNVPFEYFERILPFTNLFLYDLKIMDSELHKRYTGVENTLILDNYKRLLALGAKIWVRIPIIEGVNDSEDCFLQIKAFFDSYGYPERVEILPYHAMGAHKYTELGLECAEFKAPSNEKIEYLKSILER